MLKSPATLIAKKQLTHDVYELVYTCPALSEEIPQAGQYIMFQLEPGLNRAYSFASFDGDTCTLIIKRIPDGRGSPLICDAPLGSVIQSMLPLGHFVLQETPRNKCFIGTGTGFAPLYCQMLASPRDIRVAFIFGVRTFGDSFYQQEIGALGEAFQDFQYMQYFSRETDFSSGAMCDGYVTDWITPENIAHFEEFYLCGSPHMVKSAREILETLGVAKEYIFWEQY